MRKLVLLAWVACVAFLLADLSSNKLAGDLAATPPVKTAPTGTATAGLPADPGRSLTGPAVVPPGTPASTDEPTFTLRGTVVGTKQSLALVLEGTEFVALALGESRQGWKLTRVEANRAQFEKDGHIAMLALTDASPTPVEKAEPLTMTRERRNEMDLSSMLKGVRLDAEPRGLRVARVAADSTLAGFGLQPGDLILDINGHPVRTLDEASRLMPVLEGEDDFSLNVERSGKTVPLRFSLAR